ncbi:MAG: beta-propeller domain-containing protein [Polyangiales bacterium]
MHARAMAIALAIAATHCAPADEVEPDPAPARADHDPTALVSFAGCQELDSFREAQQIAEMRARLEQSKRNYLRPLVCRDGGPLIARDAGRPSVPSAAPTGSVARSDTSASTPSAPSPPSAPGAVSGTNNQVAGVDEADMVKTVDGLLYVLGDDALHVLEAWPASATRELVRVPVAGTPRQLLVEGGRALVYAAIGGTPRACTYGYDCDFSGDGTRTQVTVFDVSAPSQPRVLRTLTLSGSLLAARRIGSTVHTVVTERDIPLTLSYVPANLPRTCGREWSADEVEAAFAALATENEAIIRAAELHTALPTIADSAASATPLDCSRYRAPSQPRGGSFVSVVSLDLARDEPATQTTLIGRPGAVYVAPESLYIAVRDDVRSGQETSVVHRFRVGASPALTRYEASGVVPGHVLNQFAMDEWRGHLRIATTRGWVPDPTTESTFSVLAQRGAKLEVVGQVGQIAPGEDIRSVRFAGARGYVVTFKKTDPLFVLDLADPAAPRVRGELKIPGFSTYMHALDDGHLLTIGYDSDDQGSFAYFQGVLLQIFDVSDPTRPSQLHKTVLGTRGSSSEALTNHLAFNYFADKRVLAVPMTLCDGGQAGSFGTTMRFSGLMLFDVDLARGIVERGRVAHPPLDGQGYRDALCSNWWTNATSNVKRSVFMDDFVYSVAPDVVRVQALGELGRDLAVVPLFAERRPASAGVRPTRPVTTPGVARGTPPPTGARPLTTPTPRSAN